MGKSGNSVPVRLRLLFRPKFGGIGSIFFGMRVFNAISFAVVRMCHPSYDGICVICLFLPASGALG